MHRKLYIIRLRLCTNIVLLWSNNLWWWWWWWLLCYDKYR